MLWERSRCRWDHQGSGPGIISSNHILQLVDQLNADRPITHQLSTRGQGGEGWSKRGYRWGGKRESEHVSFDRIAHFQMIAEKNVVKQLIVHLSQSRLSVYDEKNLYSCHEAVFKWHKCSPVKLFIYFPISNINIDNKHTYLNEISLGKSLFHGKPE